MAFLGDDFATEDTGSNWDQPSSSAASSTASLLPGCSAELDVASDEEQEDMPRSVVVGLRPLHTAPAAAPAPAQREPVADCSAAIHAEMERREQERQLRQPPPSPPPLRPSPPPLRPSPPPLPSPPSLPPLSPPPLLGPLPPFSPPARERVLYGGGQRAALRSGRGFRRLRIRGGAFGERRHLGEDAAGSPVREPNADLEAAYLNQMLQEGRQEREDQLRLAIEGGIDADLQEEDPDDPGSPGHCVEGARPVRPPRNPNPPPRRRYGAGAVRNQGVRGRRPVARVNRAEDLVDRLEDLDQRLEETLAAGPPPEPQDECAAFRLMVGRMARNLREEDRASAFADVLAVIGAYRRG
ncbi:Titin [Frankliniella fusca]|uniref:Titin n=1 Tax=Frankliniella fusca TaxID=407009 RepID=A0AAE1L9H5_9NEOP|nr:Titin [Frankliniella fusca]